MKWTRAVAGAAVILAVALPAAACSSRHLLRAFAAGPAARPHPAHDNLAQVKPPYISALYDGID